MNAVGQDLRDALESYEHAGALLRISAEVDWKFEAAAVLWRLQRGPAVLFENVRGYEAPLVGNVLNERRKLAIALGVDEPEMQRRLAQALDAPRMPVEVGSGACQEVVLTKDLNLLSILPVPAISELDGGRYLSAGIIVSKDPDTGRRNMAISRIHVREDGRLTCYLAPTHTSHFLQRCAELGRPLEVAVVIGAHPAVMAASQFLTPLDEMELAGAIFGEPLRTVRCRTVDLEVPAGAEVVLEGTIDSAARELEGPFGEFPGTYAPARPNPLIQLTAVTTRQAPMLQMIVAGNHPEHLVTGAVAREASLLRAVRAVVPGTRAVRMPEGGVCRFHAIVSITKRADGEGKLAALTALTHQDLLKNVIVVDDDIDIDDSRHVEWAVATRMRADEDVLIIPGMKSNPVDAMSRDRMISKLAIDATLTVGEMRERLPMADVPAEIRARVADRWSELIGNEGVS